MTDLDNQNRIISEEIYNYNKTKIIFKYSENGIIEEIEEYESGMENDEYKLSRLTKIKVNKKPENLTTEIIRKINSKIM